ncbi:helix-turn-helix domain-containing protein [Georgenia sp. Z1344]|uniref:helix-turn-helix domain-containing protein n=1 Tax=Georgenia sp. Z1344 TaxID=3416706 RepID=UPI003CF796DE
MDLLPASDGAEHDAIVGGRDGTGAGHDRAGTGHDAGAELGAGDTSLAGWLPALARISAALNGDSSVVDLLDEVARTACELLGYDFCAVTLPTGDRTALLIQGAHGLSAEYVATVNAEHPILLDAHGSPSSKAFLTGTAHQIEDALHDPRFRPWGGVALQQGYASLLAVPLVAGGEPLGTLNCYTSRRHRADSREIGLVTMLADQAANAIATAQLRSSEQRTITRLNEANRDLTHQRDLQRQSMEIHEQFTAQTLGGGGVAAVVTALARILGAPVAVRDVDGDLLHATEQDGAALPEALVLPRWSDGEETSFLDGDRDRTTAVAVDGVELLRAPVLLQDDVVAWVWAGCRPDQLGDLDRRALDHAATMVALEVLRHRAVAESMWRDTADVLASLLDDGAAYGPTLRERAGRLGHDLALAHAVLVTHLGAEPAAPPVHRIASHLANVLGADGPRPLVGRRGDHLVVLVPDVPGRAEALLAAIEEHLGRLLGAGDRAGAPPMVTVGPVADIGEYGSAVVAAAGAVDLALRYGRGGTAVHLDHTGLTGLLLRTADTVALQEFVDRTVGALVEYDAANGAHLVDTLRVLLRTNLGAARAAEELYLHKNTVNQRRRRIEEIVGGELADTDVLLEVAGAMRVLDVLRVLA